MQLEGRKFDTGKPRYELIPPEALDALAALYTLGAAKYGDRNWEKGMGWGRIFSALMRHAWAWFKGEQFDPTDGQHHLIAVAWNAFTLYIYEQKKLGVDDRTLGKGSTQMAETDKADQRVGPTSTSSPEGTPPSVRTDNRRMDVV